MGMRVNRLDRGKGPQSLEGGGCAHRRRLRLLTERDHSGRKYS
jgi:hypothetical protein